MAYQPGDTLDVLCPNRASEVGELLHRLGLEDQKSNRIQLSLRKETKKKSMPFSQQQCFFIVSIYYIALVMTLNTFI